MLPKPVILCAGKKCCPVLTQLSQNSYQIRDDFGNTSVFDKAGLTEFYNQAKSSAASEISFGGIKMDTDQALELSKII